MKEIDWDLTREEEEKKKISSRKIELPYRDDQHWKTQEDTLETQLPVGGKFDYQGSIMMMAQYFYEKNIPSLISLIFRGIIETHYRDSQEQDNSYPMVISNCGKYLYVDYHALLVELSNLFTNPNTFIDDFKIKRAGTEKDFERINMLLVFLSSENGLLVEPTTHVSFLKSRKDAFFAPVIIGNKQSIVDIIIPKQKTKTKKENMTLEEQYDYTFPSRRWTFKKPVQLNAVVFTWSKLSRMLEATKRGQAIIKDIREENAKLQIIEAGKKINYFWLFQAKHNKEIQKQISSGKDIEGYDRDTLLQEKFRRHYLKL